jgi:uncharacterized protein DUF4272
VNGRDDYVDINLRDADEIAGRAVVLGTLVRRAMLDVMDAEDDEDPAPDDDLFDRDGIRFDLLAWLKEQEPDAVEPDDTEMLAKPVGELSDDELDLCTDATDALAALLWVIGQIESLPSPGEVDKLGVDLGLTPEPWDDVAPFHSGAAMREEDEIAREREIAEIWFWRAALSSEGEPRDQEDRRAIRTVADEAAAARLVLTVAGDFAVDGRPFALAEQPAKDEILAGAAARLRALNWVCGYGDTWSDTPLDVS